MRSWNGKTVRIGVLCLGLAIVMVLIAACGGTTGATTTSAAGPTTTAAGPTTTAAGPTTTAAGPTTTAAAAADLGKLRVLISSPAVYPFYEAYVAKSMGFFEKRGLDVEILEVDGAEATTTAFASGQGDIQQADLSTLNPTAISALGEAKPIMFYMFMTSIFTVSVPDESPIKTAQELDGKVVAVNSEQDPGMSLIKTIQTKYGVKITPLIVNEAAQALAALDRGDAVAYASSLTGVARIEAAGKKMRQIIPQEMVDASGGFGYWASRQTMDKNPAAMKAYVEGLQEARAYIGDDPQKLVDWANSQNPIPAAELEFRKALSKAVIGIRPSWTPVGSIPPAKWQLWWDTLVANGTIDPSIGSPTDFYTNEFFEK